MTRLMFDSANIFGIHEPGGEKYMKEAGHPGWILFTEGIGSNPNNQSGSDYRQYSRQNFGIICRLNYGYAPAGTIPVSSRYADFATRCANFVAASHGCKTWIIGNEMNYALERPTWTVQASAALGRQQDSSGSDSAADEPEGGDTKSDYVVDDEGTVDEVSADQAIVEEVTISLDAPLDSGDSGGGWGWLSRFFNSALRGVSGGMGDAQLGAESSSPTATEPNAQGGGVTPSSTPMGGDEFDIDLTDPYHRADPQRFSALHMDEGLESDDESDMPLPQHSPRTSGSQVITPERYATCYRLCRDAIHAVPGHENDQVLIGSVAPWNNQTSYPGNPNGDWVLYFQDVLEELGPAGCDGITIHTYTHESDPNLIHSDVTMNAPFQDRHYEFRAYQDFMKAIPANMRHLPVYITETDQDVPWLNQNNGWVQRAYGEIDYWNRQPGNQQIRSLILYRWPKIDRWFIDGKAGVVADFRDALTNDYRWRPNVEPADYAVGDVLATTDIVNMRKVPGYIDQADDDIVAMLPAGTRVTVLDESPELADGLVWWYVRTEATADEDSQDGWLAQNSPAGVPLLRETDDLEEGGIGVGDHVRTVTYVRMRRSPGYVDKPDGDVLADLPPDTQGTVIGGPTSADGLNWWQVRTVGQDQRPLDGWMAEEDPNGTLLLESVEAPAPPSVPDNGTPDGTFETGDAVVTLDYVRVRKTPGYAGKDGSDVVKDVLPGTPGVVLGGPQTADDLTWWQVRFDAEGGVVEGWSAEVAPNGVQLLGPGSADGEPGDGEPTDGESTGAGSKFEVGQLVQASDYVRVRRSPGYANKPEEDTLGAFAPSATLNIVDGPRDADGLTWWRVGGISETAGELIGWIAESAPNGVVLMQAPPKLAGTDIPNRATGSYLGAPFRQRFGISQLWGENPQIYSRFSYDGVPLRGHNGIDFLTPTGTDLLAVEDGVVSEVVYHDLSGLGHYVKLQHGWGESIYAHLNDISIAQGQAVRRGDLIGHADSTGYSSGPHLHFSIRINPFERTDGWGGFSDPLPYMDPNDFYLPSYVLPWTARAAAAPAPAASTELTEAKQTGTGMAPDHPNVVRP